MYVANHLMATPVLDVPQCPETCECIWLHVRTCSLLLLLLYVPPGLLRHQQRSISQYIIDNADSARSTIPSCNLIIAGDFNDLPTLDIETVLALTQVVNFPTRGSATLDKLFVESKFHDRFDPPISAPKLGNSDHLTVIVKPSHENNSKIKRIVKVYDYRQSFMNEFKKRLSNIPWHLMYRSNATIDEKCECFYDIWTDAKSVIPYTFVCLNDEEKPWITPLLKSLLQKKHEAFRKKNFAVFNHLKSKLNQEIKKAKDAWVNKLKKRPTGFWSMIKEVASSKPKHSDMLHKIITEFGDPHDAAEAINTEFFRHFSPPTINNVTLETENCNNTVWNVDTSPTTVHRAINALNTRKAPGSDGLTPFLLKSCSEFVAEPIAHLLSMSIVERTVPCCWKKSHIVPVPKNNVPKLENLRPISLLPIIAKILERLVLKSIVEKLLDLYGPNQYGFRPKSSTLFAQILMQEKITLTLDDPQTRGIFILSFDMSRAFDRVPHDGILRRVSSAGLPRDFLEWYINYLSNRTQQTKLPNDIISSEKYVTSGVPQGSILSPYFFCAFAGTLEKVLTSSTMYKYADDIVIISSFYQNDDINHIIRTEFDNVNRWSTENGLILNKSKTKLLVMDKKKCSDSLNLCLPQSREIKILGIFFDETAKWSTHVRYISKKASQRIHILTTLRRIPSIVKNDLILVYRQLIQSLLEYNCALFVGITKKDAKLIEKVKRRCHRIICGPDCNSNCLPSLTENRTAQAMKLFCQALSQDHILHHLTPVVLRHSKKLSIPYCRTTRRSLAFVPFCSRLYNESFQS